MRAGGYTHGQLSTISIPPQSVAVSNSATMYRTGPTLTDSSDSTITTGFVVPPDHKPGTPITMRVIYEESSAGACGWYAYVQGLEGPVGPSTQVNEFNGGWSPPGTANQEGVVSVPADAGVVHAATFRWLGSDDPGMFIQFDLTRNGANGSDTCGFIQIHGLQVSY